MILPVRCCKPLQRVLILVCGNGCWRGGTEKTVQWNSVKVCRESFRVHFLSGIADIVTSILSVVAIRHRKALAAMQPSQYYEKRQDAFLTQFRSSPKAARHYPVVPLRFGVLHTGLIHACRKGTQLND